MPRAEPLLELADVSAAWDGHEVVRSVSLTVEEGELLSLLGPNGSGKTTLLRTIAGFERPTTGSLRLAGLPLTGIPPHRRGIGLLFQEPALFPHRSVYENIAYAPLLAHRSTPDVRAEVSDLARLLSLDELLGRSPTQLSGGERQRVALARTLAARPRLVLLDEPFASVDYEVRSLLLAEFRRALRERGTAAIHVTHDREEGLFLADRVALLFDGELRALGGPDEVFSHPPDARVARFLGYSIVPSDEGPVAVLPEELTPLPAERGAPAIEPHEGMRTAGPYTVLSAGRAARAFRAVLRGPEGERIELRSTVPLLPGATCRVGWEHGVVLSPAREGRLRPQSPRGPER